MADSGVRTHRLFDVSIPYSEEKFPRLDPREVLYAETAVEQVPGLAARVETPRRVGAVVMDTRTREVAGAAVAEALRSDGWSVEEICVPDPAPGKWPEIDDATMERVARQAASAHLIVTVGSGVITDLGKWVAGDRGIPFVAFATAASMNGYASANVAATLAGFKTLHRGRPAVAVVTTPEILRAAPYPMTTAGLADLLAKSVSSVDWYLNHRLFGDAYDPAVVDLIAGIEPRYLDHPEAVLHRESQALEALFQALVLTGVAMTLVGSSAPASGGEHMISHTLDMRSAIDGRPHDLHGRQVGVATVLALELYRRVLSVESPEFRIPPLAVDRAYWGPLTGALEKQMEGKAPRLREACEGLRHGAAWEVLRSALNGMVRAPERVRNCLAAAHGAVRAEDLGMDRGRLREALLHAHAVRSRVTILDLAAMAGILPTAAGEIVDQWA